jgi:anhydro-N-acetylmuramic acid kinase
MRKTTVKSYSILGLMSGTSLDGLDIAHVIFTQSEKGNWSFELKQAETIPYETSILNKLQIAMELSAPHLFELDVELGKYIGASVLAFAKKNDINLKTIDLIASHGQTIFHQPEKGFSIQIGSGTAIALATNVQTLNQFRAKDVLLGGQGAPLVPIGDFLLFGEEADSFLNIGGISNISFKEQHEIIAFDICPGNLPLNKLAHNKGLKYDADGTLARSGDINFFLLDLLNQLPFYSEKTPKSLGSEWLEQHFYPLIKFDKDIENNLRTVVEHEAYQIGQILTQKQLKSVLITGGGALNSFLIERIQHYYSGEIKIPERAIVEFKEAIIFGFLGVLFLEKEINTLKSVTGASHDSIGGILHLPA